MREKPLILTADDDKDFRETVVVKLKNAGFEVVAARDGNEALKKAKELLPDLVILDINMPLGPSGVDVALELKSAPETKNLKIVFLSGLENPWPAFSGEKGAVSKELGMEDFFVKTKDLSELVSKVNEVLKRTELAPQPPAAPAS